MKRLSNLLVIVALGAATLSCQDESFNDVENAVLENQTLDLIDDAEQEEPGI